MIRIRATVHRGFYRCGRHFGFGWQEYPDDAFTAGELEVLKEEPMLMVEQVDDPPAKAKGKKEAPPAPQEKAPEDAPNVQAEVMAEPQVQAEGKEKSKPKGKGK